MSTSAQQVRRAARHGSTRHPAPPRREVACPSGPRGRPGDEGERQRAPEERRRSRRRPVPACVLPGPPSCEDPDPVGLRGQGDAGREARRGSASSRPGGAGRALTMTAPSTALPREAALTSGQPWIPTDSVESSGMETATSTVSSTVRAALTAASDQATRARPHSAHPRPRADRHRGDHVGATGGARAHDELDHPPSPSGRACCRGRRPRPPCSGRCRCRRRGRRMVSRSRSTPSSTSIRVAAACLTAFCTASTQQK